MLTPMTPPVTSHQPEGCAEAGHIPRDSPSSLCLQTSFGEAIGELGLTPYNKHGTSVHPSLVSLDWLYCELVSRSKLWFSNRFGAQCGAIVLSGHLARGTWALDRGGSQVLSSICLSTYDSGTAPNTRGQLVSLAHGASLFCGEGSKALILVG